MENTSRTFSYIDYIVFASMLAVSSAIGFYYAFKDRKQRTTESFLLAGRSMNPFPVAFSLCVTFLSAVTVLGTPGEVYVYGTMYIWVLFGCTVAFAITATVYLPVYYRCNISSINQYLEMRFHRLVRIFASSLYLFQSLLYTGVVILAPSFALSAVTGINLWAAASTTAGVCILYSSLGGLKAVLWNDTLQMIIMLAGLLSVIIKASVDYGGFDKLWKNAIEGGRIEFWKFDLDPRIRHTTLSIAIGSIFFNLALYSANQGQVQRYLACRSLRSAQWAIFINGIGMFILISLAVLCGVVMYGYYHNCDPISLESVQTVSRADQLMPYLVLELFQHTPGMPGLFVAAVYSGSLSTVSTSITAMTSVVLQDFLKPFSNCSEKTFTWISKGLVAGLGLLCLFFAFLASSFKGLLQLTISVLSIASAPLLVVFSLGILFPFANTWGALAGMMAGGSGTFFLFCGKLVFPVPEHLLQRLSFNVDGCECTNVTMDETLKDIQVFTEPFNTTTANLGFNSPSVSQMADFFALSYMYTTAFGLVLGLIIGIFTSLVTGGWRKRNQVDTMLLLSCFKNQNFHKNKSSFVRQMSIEMQSEENCFFKE